MPQLYCAAELSEGDFIAIPGLPSVRIRITGVLADPDGCWTIETVGATINLPSADRKVWAIKKDSNITHCTSCGNYNKPNGKCSNPACPRS